MMISSNNVSYPALQYVQPVKWLQAKLCPYFCVAIGLLICKDFLLNHKVGNHIAETEEEKNDYNANWMMSNFVI